MLETQAIIIGLDGVEAIVEASRVGGCGLCNSVEGCASGKLSKLFCSRPRQFRVQNAIGAQVGDRVQVSVADGDLLRSALIAYIFPLLLLFVGGAAGTIMAGAYNHDMFAAIGAVVGLVAGFIMVRLFSPRQHILISAISPVINSCDFPSGSRPVSFIPVNEKE